MGVSKGNFVGLQIRIKIYKCYELHKVNEWVKLLVCR